MKYYQVLSFLTNENTVWLNYLHILYSRILQLLLLLFQLYKGRLENGTYVAIRSLSLLKKFSVQNLKVRLDLLSKLHHPHLVALWGHCIESGGRDEISASKVFLVYEYVPNGNYRAKLSGQCSIVEREL